jgi:hypothetical protein
MRRPLQIVLIVILTDWCFFWWGFSAGGTSADDAEIRSLEQRLRIWDALVREHPTETAATHALADLDRERLADLQFLAHGSITDRLLAPIFAPYFLYDLHRIRREVSGSTATP